jgi:hypothetical protein
LTTQRPGRADNLEADEEHEILPLLSNEDPNIAKEKERSIADDSGINYRELVKVFCMEISKDGEKRLLNKAVKGISFSISKEE